VTHNGQPHAAIATVGGASPPGGTPAAAALIRAIERLGDVIDLETRALQEHQPADLRDFNRRKRYGLLELSRIIRTFERDAANEQVHASLSALRAKLDRNRAVLQMHLKAVQEIAGVIGRAIQDAESDGTYSLAGELTGRRR
jgi:hypothetical protein